MEHCTQKSAEPAITSRAHYFDEAFREVRLERDEVASSEFHDCLFANNSFVESIFRQCRFVNCVFRECDLSLVEWPGCMFTQTLFERSKMIGVNWTKAHWPETGLAEPISFVGCAISHSTFLGLTLPGIAIKDCVALDVDFREADLSKADLSGTDLVQSVFGNTDLSQADLSRARNYSIDPAQNVLHQAKFSLPEALSLLHSMDIVLVDED
jgi:fluoroquinolone resistance protein